MLPGALATLPFVYPLPSHTEAYAYLYIACLPSRHPCNQQPFLRETCSPLHAISIIVVVVLAPRLHQILAPLSVSLKVKLMSEAFRVIACIYLLFSVNLQVSG